MSTADRIIATILVVFAFVLGIGVRAKIDSTARAKEQENNRLQLQVERNGQLIAEQETLTQRYLENLPTFLDARDIAMAGPWKLLSVEVVKKEEQPEGHRGIYRYVSMRCGKRTLTLPVRDEPRSGPSLDTVNKGDVVTFQVVWPADIDNRLGDLQEHLSLDKFLEIREAIYLSKLKK